MVRILANDGINSDGKHLLEEAGYDINTEKIPQDQLVTHLPDYDVVIIRSATKIRQDLIDQCPKLKIIARGGVGLDNIDVEYARSRGIEVYNTPAASSSSVAELVFSHIFALARSIHLSNREMPVAGTTQFKDLKKSYSKGMELRGKTLGILGFGRIGQEVAKIAIGMGMRVLPVDLFVEDATISVELYDMEEASVSIKIHTVSMSHMLENSDIITIHVPSTGGTALISDKEIQSMKTGVLVINTARGGTIDEKALLHGLDSGKVGGAGLDVFEDEPCPKQELLDHPRISVSPHIGASTIEAQANIGRELADKIIAFYEGAEAKI
ncbi:MAG: D-2-hydroxyacid dehydrogenase [Saprospiraceae bacterium]|nr:D-2-hydroxyacid dehydrogenase [Saprospiraceae bacterium]